MRLAVFRSIPSTPPVLKVSYKVEATRVEQRTDFDKLILDVETKPAISPRDAVASAGSTLVELFGLCRELNAQAEGVEVGPAPVAEETNPEMAVPIEDLNLTQRSYNCLKREGVHTIGELVSHTEQDLLDIRNFGMKSIDEVKEKLQTLGLSLKSSPMAFDTNNLEAAPSSRRKTSDSSLLINRLFARQADARAHAHLLACFGQ